MKISATNWLLPWVLAIHYCNDKITCCCSCRPSTPPGRSSGRKTERRRSVLLENWQDRCLDRYSQKLILWVQFFYPLISRKTLKSSQCWLFPVTSRTFLKNKRAWLHVFLLSQGHTHMTFPSSSLEQALGALSGAVSWAAVLILPPVKLSSQFSHCTLFLSQQIRCLEQV